MEHTAKEHICVCICTFKRPGLLTRLLEKLDLQDTRGVFTYSVVVADNDCNRSAAAATAAFAGRSSLAVVYCVEPRQNIALVRNKALEQARGDYIAFIDDDEYPEPDWLHTLHSTCVASGADGVLGPVLPCFEETPPAWAVRGKFFERPSHPTGQRIPLAEARTGNVLFRTAILQGAAPYFNTEFATGGEDAEFFRVMMGRGHIFVWCQEAPVYEVVPASRCTRSYLLRRALLRGSISRKFGAGPFRIMKSLLAVSVYGLSLPVSLMAGEHHFMKYLMKLCDHAGLLLGVLRLDPIRERDP